MESRGLETELLQPRTLFPVPQESLDFIASHERTYVIDHNSSRQLAGLLTRAGADHTKIEHLERYDGVPIRPFSVANEILKREGRA